MRRKVVYVTNNALGEPHVVSQVLPYLACLRDEYDFHLVTFEKDAVTTDESDAARARLEKEGIAWTALQHRPPLMGSLRNVAEGVRATRRLARDSDLVHARSYVAASIASRAATAAGVPWLFDMRGFYLDERIDAGILRRGSAVERLYRAEERRLLRKADAIVVLTDRAREVLSDDRLGARREDAVKIPCCIDLGAFTPGPQGASASPVIVYSGTLGSSYLEARMADVAGALKREVPSLRARVASRQDATAFVGHLQGAGFAAGEVDARRLAPYEVPAFLRGASVGIVMVHRSLAKLAASPIKAAEYLAAGIPVIISEGCGDMPELVEQERVGVAVDPADPAGDVKAAARIRELLADPALKARCRDVATRHFAVPAGAESYRAVYRRMLARGNA